MFALRAEQVFQAQFRLGRRNHIPQRLGQTQRPQRPRHMAKLHRPVALLDLPVGGHGYPHDPGHILLRQIPPQTQRLQPNPEFLQRLGIS